MISHFYGAPPMALLTVGAGTLLLGKDVIGAQAAVGIDWVLWTARHAPAAWPAPWRCPYLTFTRHEPAGRAPSAAG